MPAGMGWTGAQFSTPASGGSMGSQYTLASGSTGNSDDQSPAQSGGAPSWTGGLMSSSAKQALVFVGIVVFIAAWHAHGFSLVE